MDTKMTALPLSIAQVHAFLALQGHSVRVHHPPTREPNAHLHRFWQAERGESISVISADVVPPCAQRIARALGRTLGHCIHHQDSVQAFDPDLSMSQTASSVVVLDSRLLTQRWITLPVVQLDVVLQLSPSALETLTQGRWLPIA
ncbi:hypothetical protein GGC03_26040 (plasmid) [Vibrio sp. THAF191c]|uniref:hypothetical protein n=2 Tax=Vibrio TaxID=662 RepID=UPI0012A9109B|nr:hypothetical protein [Vibrio sp. THAF191d]QFT39966.1 hypothetical protein FIU99_26615 [Vibrio sp. THAF64]QGM37909.1 hypothetical protein GGC04_26815 [Vibrio sp. THAF191d]QGN73252.1 hypothetical protein GGC03_26040 [Vibrio sp. THAF191c]